MCRKGKGDHSACGMDSVQLHQHDYETQRGRTAFLSGVGNREGRTSMDVHDLQPNGPRQMQTPLMENAQLLKQTAQNGSKDANEE